MMKKFGVRVLLLGAFLNGKHIHASSGRDLLIEAIADRLTILTLYMIMPSYEEILEHARQEEERRNQAELTAQAFQKLLIKEEEKEQERNQKRAEKQERSRKSQLENTKRQKEAALQERQIKYQENFNI